MHSPSSTARPAAPHRERGIALFVVIVFVMLSMLLALWASRTAIFNEMVVGNDADYQRAFEAAQSLIQDAELDIRSTGGVTLASFDQYDSTTPSESKELSPFGYAPFSAGEHTVLIADLGEEWLTVFDFKESVKRPKGKARSALNLYWNIESGYNKPTVNVDVYDLS